MPMNTTLPQPPAVARPPGGPHHLLDDLAGQLAPEPARRWRRSRTPWRSRLAGHAHRRAVAVVHEHRLDPGAVVELEQPLDGVAVAVGRLGHRRQRGGQLGVEAGPQRPGQRCQLGGLGELAVQAVPHLIDPVARLAVEQVGERAAVEVVAAGHGGRAYGGAGGYRRSMASHVESAHPEYQHRDIQGGSARRCSGSATGWSATWA